MRAKLSCECQPTAAIHRAETGTHRQRSISRRRPHEEEIFLAIAIKPHILYPYHFGSTDTSELVELLKDQPETEVRIRSMA